MKAIPIGLAILLAGCAATVQQVATNTTAHQDSEHPAAQPESAPRSNTEGTMTTATRTPESTDPSARSSADQAWIETACPRAILGPASWKTCAERNLQALREGVPDISALEAADQEWIESSCPRAILGPASWKTCAERNLQALREGVPNLDKLNWSASATGNNAGSEADQTQVQNGEPPAHSITGGQAGSTIEAASTPGRAKQRTPPTMAAKPRETEPKTPKDPAPHLPKPRGGERWLCIEIGSFASPEDTPTIVLTRESPRSEAEGIGKIAVAGPIHEALFEVTGIERRWDWNEGLDTIVIDTTGSGAYYDFRWLEPGETKTAPSGHLYCVEG